MPVCPKCDIAYFESESHACTPRSSTWSRTPTWIMVVTGLLAGANIVGLIVISEKVPWGKMAGTLFALVIGWGSWQYWLPDDPPRFDKRPRL